MEAVAASAEAPKVANPWLIAFAVSIATFMEVLDTTITNVSLTHIAGSLGAGQDESTWVLTSYLVSNGIVLPLSGWLSNVFGRKRYFIFCIAGFTLASFACGAATSLGMLVAFRLLQGIAGGGLQPTQQAIMLDTFSGARRGIAFAISGVTLIAAPVIGPTLGGWITDNFDWRWIFFINVPFGIIAMLLVANLVEDPEHSKARGAGRIDFIGLGLVTLGLGCLQIVLDKGQQDDWFESNFILIFGVLSAVGIGGAIAWLLTRADPIIDLRLLKIPSFGMSFVLIFFTGFILYGGTLLIPLMVQSLLGYDATLSGMILSPGGIAVIFLMPLMGKFVNMIQSRWLVMTGMTLIAVGMFYTSFLAPNIDYETLVMMRIMQVLGLPFLFIPISTLAYMHIPPAKNNKASALFALGRNLGGSVGIALVTTYLVRGMQSEQHMLAAHTVVTDPVWQATLRETAQAYVNKGMSWSAATAQASGKLYQQMRAQASFLAYQDSYRLLAGIAVGGLALATLLPKNSPGKVHAPAGAH